jgi:uncharacterized protein (DUF2141 family)
VVRKIVFTVLITACAALAQAPTSSQKLFTLTVRVEGVNSLGGNVGVLIFNSTKGWPEDVKAALKDVVVPAHAGVVTVRIEKLPAGIYAIAVGHDVNVNHKVDKNFLGVPKEQWGMSNNPHALVKPPSFTTAQFELKGDAEIRIRMQ